jgi:hypothetical protein
MVQIQDIPDGQLAKWTTTKKKIIDEMTRSEVSIRIRRSRSQDPGVSISGSMVRSEVQKGHPQMG